MSKMDQFPAGVKSSPVKRRARFSRAASARVLLHDFEKGELLTGLTYGQFSLIDLLQATLELTGEADVTISTWSAGFYDVDAAERFRDSGLIRSIRFVMDASLQKRGQATAYDVAELFGRDAVRTTRSHAKFATVTNDEWQIAITSSMNLNLNSRVEQFQLVDCAVTAGMFLDFVDELFASEPFDGANWGLPALPGLEQDSGLLIEATPWRDLERGGYPKIGVFGD